MAVKNSLKETCLEISKRYQMHFFWDIDLSNMSRLGVVRKIRGKDKHVIIIGQTADALAEDKQKALEAGCNDYIAKPIKTAFLMEKIKQFDN